MAIVLCLFLVDNYSNVEETSIAGIDAIVGFVPSVLYLACYTC